MVKDDLTGLICDRCGIEIEDDPHIADWWLANIVREPSGRVDLCSECNVEIINIVKKWWQGGQCKYYATKVFCTCKGAFEKGVCDCDGNG